MLVLTRWPQEKIRINDDIHLRVLSVQGDKISLGIEAPDNIQVLRKPGLCKLA